MENSQIVKPETRLAFMKEVEGIELYWFPAMKVAGIHQRGLMKILGTESDLVRNVIASLEGERQIAILEAEVQTGGGLQKARVVSELDLPEILEEIGLSKAKVAVRKNAIALLKRLATVGFKLMTTYHVVPEELFPELKPETRALSPVRAAIAAAGDDPIAIAKASHEHFPDLATSRLPIEVHAAQITEVRRYVGR